MKDWILGGYSNDSYIHESGDIFLKLHPWVQTGSKGKPVRGGYSIELETKINPYDAKYYFKDIVVGYPSFIFKGKLFNRKSDAIKAMRKWAKTNKEAVEHYLNDFGGSKYRRI